MGKSQSHFSDKLTKKASKFAKCEARIPALVSDPHLCHFIVYTIRNSSRWFICEVFNVSIIFGSYYIHIWGLCLYSELTYTMY